MTLGFLQRVGLVAVCFGFLYVGWWPVAIIYALILGLFVVPYELILVGGLIDGYYGLVSATPWYTLVAVGFCFMVIFIKPLLRSQQLRITLDS